jgi:spore maturation protein CgeB
MRFVLYTHSLVSDWNHGNAHFLRGVLRELQSRGDETLALEPENGWSRTNLLAEHGAAATARFQGDFPDLTVCPYGPDFDHEAATDHADVVLMHEWNEPSLIARLGVIRRRGGRFTLLFHDTHHRAASDDGFIAGLALQDYDAILAFGEALRQRYLQRGWGRQVFTWHEAADTRLFHPRTAASEPVDLVWIGNWGDGERERELNEFLIEPARRLRLNGTIRGVRYPDTALAALRRTSLHYRGWIANADVPDMFAAHRLTVHIPRRPYVTALPGIPTIRVFEALACGIPLICAPWNDEEQLFRSTDFLVAHSSDEMAMRMDLLRKDCDFARALAESGLETIRRRHTCFHRVDELLAIVRSLRGEVTANSLALAEVAA